MYARAAAPSRHRTQASNLACSLPPLHNQRTPEPPSPPPLRTWQRAVDFNQPLDWNVSQVTSMKEMFTVRPGR